MNPRHLLLAAALLISTALAIAGCGQDQAGESGGRPQAADQQDLTKKLIGKWEGSGQAEANGSDAAADALGAAMGRYEMTVEFRADGTSSVAVAIGGLPDPNPLSGSWKIVKADAERAIVEYTGTADGQTQTMRAEIAFPGPDQITYRDSGDSAMPVFLLTRVSEP